MSDRPRRIHALHVLSELRRQEAASVIGPEAAWLVTTVVCKADDLRTGDEWVLLWNSELFAVCGLTQKSLNRARRAAMDAGWLEYIPGHKGLPGRYRATIPTPSNVSLQERNATEKGDGFRSETPPKTVSMPDSVPISVPNSSAKRHRNDASTVALSGETTNHSSLSLSNSPPPSPVPLVEAVAETGVAAAEEAVRVAIDRGLTEDTIRRLVAHFLASPGRWQPGALHARLTKLGSPSTPVTEAWPDPSPSWRPATPATPPAPSRTELEAECGAVLDAMADSELSALLEGLQPRDRMIAKTAANPRRSSVRVAMLQALNRRSGSAS